MMLELFNSQESLRTSQSELMGLQCQRRVPGALLCQGGPGSPGSSWAGSVDTEGLSLGALYN